MASEMTKINYSLWQEFIPRPRWLASPPSVQLSLPTVYSWTLQPTLLSFPSPVPYPLGWVPDAPRRDLSLPVQHSLGMISALLHLPFICSHWFSCYVCPSVAHADFLSLELNTGKKIWSQGRGEVVPWQALGRIILGQVCSCPSGSQVFFPPRSAILELNNPYPCAKIFPEKSSKGLFTKFWETLLWYKLFLRGKASRFM